MAKGSLILLRTSDTDEMRVRKVNSNLQYLMEKIPATTLTEKDVRRIVAEMLSEGSVKN